MESARRNTSTMNHGGGFATFTKFTEILKYLRALRVCRQAFVVVLLLVLPATSPAQESLGTPFTTGITDALSLKTVVDARIAHARQLLAAMLAVKGQRTAANTLK